MSKLRLNNINVHYGSKHIVHNVSFALDDGKIGCLLGPSACGKTTVLRTIAGFEKPSDGSIYINEHVICCAKKNVAPEKRKIGMVFQDFALFPHLNIADNIRFGIKALSAKAQQQRVSELLAMMGMASLAQSFPHQLSGGQQQRVALARAMAPRPSILLLDEPFSSMDVELREQLAHELRAILKQQNVTAILVTHDQNEAFAMADEICVMNEGSILQHDSAYNLYHRPINRFVADFIGEGVIVKATVVNAQLIQTELGDIEGQLPKSCLKGDAVDVLIRPDDVIHNDAASETAVVVERAFRGSNFLYTLRMDSGAEVLSLVPSHHDHKINEKIGIQLELDHLVIFTK